MDAPPNSFSSRATSPVELVGLCVLYALITISAFVAGGFSTPLGALLLSFQMAMGVLVSFRLGLIGALVVSLFLAVVEFFAIFRADSFVFEGDALFGVVYFCLFSIVCVSVALASSYLFISIEIAEKQAGTLWKIFNSLPIGIGVRTRSGKMIYLNDRWASFTKHSVDEMLKSDISVAPLNLGDDWQAAIECLADEGHGFVHYEHVDLTDNSGQKCHMAVLTSRVYIDQIEDFGTISLLIDETSAQRYESKIKISERRLRTALSNAGIGFWDEDIANDDVLADDNWFDLLAASEEERSDPVECWVNRLHPDDAVRVLKTYESFVHGDGDKSLEIEYRIRKGRKSYIWVQDRVTLTEFTEDGQPVRMMGTLHDISHRKKYEIDLKFAKERAESASAAKGYFLATISHEIRTPLNAIIGLSGYLWESDLNKEQKELAQGIRAGANSLLLLVNDLLDFSKIEAGRLSLEVEEFPLRMGLEGAVEIFALRASEKNLAFEVEIASSIPEYAIGDMTRLIQVVNNLLANALKFTEKGTIGISVRPKPLDSIPPCYRPDATESIGYLDGPDHEYIEVVVEDTGIGIPEKKQHDLFDAFSQVDPSTTRRYGGTGLGLAICKRLVRAMGGRIWLDSKPGEGTKAGFVVRAKLVREEKVSSQVPVSGSSGTVQRIAERYPCSILFIGPMDDIAKQLKGCRQMGYFPHSLDFKKVCPRSLMHRSYDLVFLCMRSPNESLDFVRQIQKSVPGQKKCSIIGLVPDQEKDKFGDRCSLSGVRRLISEEASPQLLRALIIDVSRERD